MKELRGEMRRKASFIKGLAVDYAIVSGIKIDNVDLLHNWVRVHVGQHIEATRYANWLDTQRARHGFYGDPEKMRIFPDGDLQDVFVDATAKRIETAAENSNFNEKGKLSRGLFCIASSLLLLEVKRTGETDSKLSEHFRLEAMALVGRAIKLSHKFGDEVDTSLGNKLRANIQHWNQRRDNLDEIIGMMTTFIFN